VEQIFAEKKFAVILFYGNLFWQIAEKTAKIAKIRTRKNLVPHGIFSLSTVIVAVVHNKKGAKKNFLNFKKFIKGKKRKIYSKKKRRNLRFKKGVRKKGKRSKMARCGREANPGHSRRNLK